MQGTSCRAGDQQEVGGLLAGGSGQCGIICTHGYVARLG